MVMAATRSLARKAGGVPSICSYCGCWKIEDDIRCDIDRPLARMSTLLLRPDHVLYAYAAPRRYFLNSKTVLNYNPILRMPFLTVHFYVVHATLLTINHTRRSKGRHFSSWTTVS
jgi:hypothetical protein